MFFGEHFIVLALILKINNKEIYKKNEEIK